MKEEEKMSAERERRVKQIVLRTLLCIRTQVNFCRAFELQKKRPLKVTLDLTARSLSDSVLIAT